MPSLAAGAIVFLTSAAVLVLEILAGRLLAPYVGVTLETFTGIIGVVLAGIAAGSWYGGKLADRLNPRAMLGPLVLSGGVLALLVLPLITFFGAPLRGGGVPAILILSTVGFFAPAAVLSAVTPTVVKIQLATLDETGRVVGRLSALSTAGAIFGTFVTGFVLVAAFPSRPVILGVGAGLLAGGLWLWLWLRPPEVGLPTPLLALGAIAAALTMLSPVPCDVESTYYCAVIEEDDARSSGRVLVLDLLRHSYVDLDDPTHLEFAYVKVFGDVAEATAPGGEPLDTLHIGGGGFTMPRYLEETRPGSTNVVLEIDPTLLELAYEDLGLEPSDALRVETVDARLGIAEEPSRSFDLVIGDAFGGLAVPWHLTTVEFVDEVRRVLRPGGVYMINVIDHPPLGFARAKTQTLLAAFEHVAIVAPPERVAGSSGGNFVLVASDAPIDASALDAQITARAGAEVVAAGGQAAEFAGDAQILVDDHAPVDQLLTPR